MKSIITITLLACASLAQAQEFTHTAATVFCGSDDRANGTCLSTHSGGSVTSLAFDCRITRDDIEKDKDVKTFTNLGSTSEFEAMVSSLVYGSHNAWYCTKNDSEYKNFFGTRINPQPFSGDSCKQRPNTPRN